MATGSVTAADALLATEWAKKLSDDAYSAEDHRKAAKAHRRAAQLHGYTTAGADAVGWHESAALQHRQAAKARTSRAYKAPDPTATKRRFAAYKEALSAANDHSSMAMEYARRALAAARAR